MENNFNEEFATWCHNTFYNHAASMLKNGTILRAEDLSAVDEEAISPIIGERGLCFDRDDSGSVLVVTFEEYEEACKQPDGVFAW